MAIGLKPKKMFLDPEHTFRTYINCGSLGKTSKILYSEGITNPKTGKAPSLMGVQHAAYVWLFDNMVEAKKLVADTYINNGELLTEEKWGKLVLGKARYLLSNSKYDEFVEKHSYLKPYLEK